MHTLTLAAAQQSILNALPAAVLVTRPDGSVVYANSCFNQQFGGATVEIFNNIARFFRTVDPSHIPNSAEIVVQVSDGSPTWLLLTPRQSSLDGEAIFFLTVAEVRTNEQSDAVHREQASVLQRFFDTPGALRGIVEVAGNNILHIHDNLTSANFFGFSPGDMQGRFESALGINPHFTEHWVTHYLLSKTTGQPVSFEYTYPVTENQRWLSATVSYLGDSPTGNPRFAYIAHDITENKYAEKNLAQQIIRLQALNKIDQAITSSTDLNTILKVLVEEVVERLQVDAASVLLLNNNTQTLDFAAKEGFLTDALQFTSLKIGAGLAGKAAKEGRIIHIAHLDEMSTNPILAQSIAEEHFISYFGIPLIAKGQLMGVLEIFHRSELAHDPEWLTFLQTLASQAAISIDNARLLELTRQSLNEANALYQINKHLVAADNPDQIMETVVNLLKENFGYHYVQIYTVEPQSGDFIVRAGSGQIGARLKEQGYRLSAGAGIVGYTAETNLPFFTNDVDNVISFIRNPMLPETKSELAVPIKVGEQFLGLLDVQQAPPGYLTERDVQLVTAVADQLAVALVEANLYTNLQNSLRQEKAIRAQLIHSEKLTVAGRLLASVAHELNNPLQAIQNALFLLKEEKGISTQGKQDLEIVLSETERMATMLGRLRTTYQPISIEDFQPVQINDIIEDVFALIATHLRHNRISFQLHSAEALPPVPGLASQLKQVILNLFMNAVDAMPEGGHLTVITQCVADCKEILVTVSDTGPGIHPDILPMIFDPFVTDKERGTGLGLAISYEIILKHHGRIRAENNHEHGAKFSLWLPMEQPGEQ